MELSLLGAGWQAECCVTRDAEVQERGNSFPTTKWQVRPAAHQATSTQPTLAPSTHVHQLCNGLVVLARCVQQVGFAKQHRHRFGDVAPLDAPLICLLPAEGQQTGAGFRLAGCVERRLAD